MYRVPKIKGRKGLLRNGLVFFNLAAVIIFIQHFLFSMSTYNLNNYFIVHQIYKFEITFHNVSLSIKNSSENKNLKCGLRKLKCENVYFEYSRTPYYWNDLDEFKCIHRERLYTIYYHKALKIFTQFSYMYHSLFTILPINY